MPGRPSPALMTPPNSNQSKIHTAAKSSVIEYPRSSCSSPEWMSKGQGARTGSCIVLEAQGVEHKWGVIHPDSKAWYTELMSEKSTLPPYAIKPSRNSTMSESNGRSKVKTVKHWLTISCASIEYRRRVMFWPGEKRTTGHVSYILPKSGREQKTISRDSKCLLVVHNEQRLHPQLLRWSMTWKALSPFYNKCLEEEGRSMISSSGGMWLDPCSKGLCERYRWAERHWEPADRAQSVLEVEAQSRVE